MLLIKISKSTLNQPIVCHLAFKGIVRTPLIAFEKTLSRILRLHTWLDF